MQKNQVGKKVSILWSLCVVGVVLSQSLALADVNTINTEQVIPDRGTLGNFYSNTANHYTQFVNDKGIWLQKGLNIRGFEVDSNGQQTGNGGSFKFSSPDGVVRLDGNVDLHGFQVGSHHGQGGNVVIDAAYLYQSGNIMANGNGNGGNVSINVNSATFTPSAKIDVSSGGIGDSTSNMGGFLNINSTGIIDIKDKATFSVAGLRGSDQDVIQIVTGFLSNAGIIKADSVSGTANQGGTIRLTGNHDIQVQPVADAINNSGIFTPCEAKAVIQDLRHTVLQYPAPIRYSAVVNTGTISANGLVGSGGKGGDVIVVNAFNLINKGTISANGALGSGGGNGGNISSTTPIIFQNSGTISANGGDGTGDGGFGGQGGTIVMKTASNQQWENTGTISANGGNGTGSNGNGGNGGKLDLAASNLQTTNLNSGNLFAKGGNGKGDVFSKGGGSGTIKEVFIFNTPEAVVDNSSGHN